MTADAAAFPAAAKVSCVAHRCPHSDEGMKDDIGHGSDHERRRCGGCSPGPAQNVQDKTGPRAQEPCRHPRAIDVRRFGEARMQPVLVGAHAALGQDMGHRHRHPGDDEDPLPGQRLQDVGKDIRHHQHIDHDPGHAGPDHARQVQPEGGLGEALHVHRGKVVVRGVDPGLRDPDEAEPGKAHQLDQRQHHRDLAHRAAGGQAGGEEDAGQAVEQEGHGIEGRAEGEARVKARVLGLAEAGVIVGVHHQHPHAHVGDEAVPPAAGGGAALGAKCQPGVGIAVFGNRQSDRGQEPQQVEGQQHAIELVEPVLDRAEDQRDRIDDDDARGERIGEPGIVLQRERHHRALEHRVIDRRGEEDQRRHRGAGAPEQDAREQRHAQPGADRVAGEHRVHHRIGDHRQHQPDDRVARAIGKRERGRHHQIEHCRADRPPGHRQRQPPHPRVARHRAVGEFELFRALQFSGHCGNSLLLCVLSFGGGGAGVRPRRKARLRVLGQRRSGLGQRRLRLGERQDIDAGRVELGGPARLDHDRRRHLLDHRRPEDAVARTELRALVDRRVLLRAVGREDHLAGAGKGGMRPLSRCDRHPRGLVDGAGQRAFDVHHLDHAARFRIGVKLFVAGVEGGLETLERGLGHLEGLDRDGAFMHLPDIAHVERAQHRDALGPEAVAGQIGAALRLELLEQCVKLGRGLGPFKPHRRRRHVVVFHVRDDLAEGAQPRGELGDQHLADAHLAGERGDMGGRRPAGAVQHEVARVIAALDRDPPDRVHHVVVDDGEHAMRRLLDADAKRRGQMRLDRAAGFRDVQRQPPADEPVGVQIAQNQVRVGGRRLLAALIVAGRARFRARRLRPHLQQPDLVDPADRAAARAQGLDLDHRDADAIAQEVDVLRDIGAAVAGQGDVKRRAAHVDGDDVLHPPGLAEIQRRLRCRGRARVDRIDRLVRHHPAKRQPAVRLEVAHRGARAERLEIAVDLLDIAREDRRQIGVHDRGRGAGVFAHLRIERAAQREAHTRHHLAHDLAGAALVGGVQHRPDEGDRDRLDALGQEMAAGLAHVLLVQRAVHGAGRQHPLAHAAAQIARHQHPRRRIVGVVAIAVFLVAEADLDAVLVAGRGDQPGARALVLDQRVQPDGGAVDAQIGVRDDLARRDAGLFLDQGQAVLDRAGRVLRRRERLEDPHAAAAVGEDEVGEGAAGVDAEAVLVLHGMGP
ncbi:hypothetical protein SDC9_32079 [bioreactor metagenome]|uniref:Uncharacterized protein n=1 Tax=bioreactor metagenome TaxID=1076179 RepID=A0A644V5K9_9ZZZZ